MISRLMTFFLALTLILTSLPEEAFASPPTGRQDAWLKKHRRKKQREMKKMSDITQCFNWTKGNSGPKRRVSSKPRKPSSKASSNDVRKGKENICQPEVYADYMDLKQKQQELQGKISDLTSEKNKRVKDFYLDNYKTYGHQQVKTDLPRLHSRKVDKHSESEKDEYQAKIDEIQVELDEVIEDKKEKYQYWESLCKYDPQHSQNACPEVKEKFLAALLVGGSQEEFVQNSVTAFETMIKSVGNLPTPLANNEYDLTDVTTDNYLELKTGASKEMKYALGRLDEKYETAKNAVKMYEEAKKKNEPLDEKKFKSACGGCSDLYKYIREVQSDINELKQNVKQANLPKDDKKESEDLLKENRLKLSNLVALGKEINCEKLPKDVKSCDDVVKDSDEKYSKYMASPSSDLYLYKSKFLQSFEKAQNSIDEKSGETCGRCEALMPKAEELELSLKGMTKDSEQHKEATAKYNDLLGVLTKLSCYEPKIEEKPTCDEIKTNVIAMLGEERENDDLTMSELEILKKADEGKCCDEIVQDKFRESIVQPKSPYEGYKSINDQGTDFKVAEKLNCVSCIAKTIPKEDKKEEKETDVTNSCDAYKAGNKDMVSKILASKFICSQGAPAGSLCNDANSRWAQQAYGKEGVYGAFARSDVNMECYCDPNVPGKAVNLTCCDQTEEQKISSAKDMKMPNSIVYAGTTHSLPAGSAIKTMCGILNGEMIKTAMQANKDMEKVCNDKKGNYLGHVFKVSESSSSGGTSSTIKKD